MREFLPLLMAIVVGVIIFRRSRPKEGWKASTIRSYRKRPIATILWLLVPAIWLIGFFVGAPILAREIFDTTVPSRDQIRTARLIIALPVAMPVLVLFVWAYWSQRKADRHMRSQVLTPKFDDPTKTSVLEN